MFRLMPGLVICAGVASVTFTHIPVLAAESDDSERKNRPFAEQRREVQKVTVELDDRRVELLPGPLYTYEEVIHRWHDGTSWVWGKQGRPSVFLNMMTLNGTRYYEFISLTASRPSVEISYGSNWSPNPNWRPRKVSKAPAPAGNRKSRLIQMRSIARRFRGQQVQSGKVQQLRCLPQPIYRYQRESDESLDGAIFAFLRESDLETILVIDATKDQSGATWMFDCMPVSIDQQEMRLDDKLVWERERISYGQAGLKSSPYHIFRRAARNSERAESARDEALEGFTP